MQSLDDTNMFIDIMPKESLTRIYNLGDYAKISRRFDITPMQKLNVEILNLLKSLGFSLEMEGTYLLADVIMAAYIFLNNAVENNDDYELYYAYLQRLMKNPYSQFYFDLARNEHAMGTTSLHNRINNAYLERNKEHINKNVEYEIFGYDKDGDIYDRSLDLAEYLFEKNQKKNKRR